ncbi:MAG: hypothetical protein M1819_003053 [Sarea resinae]|nr:MAG: hypothetical protein M1819_003053 [Sarea resinae]
MLLPSAHSQCLPSIATLESLIHQALPSASSNNLTIVRVEDLQGTVNSLFLLRLSDGSAVVLKMAPQQQQQQQQQRQQHSSSTRLLRHEHRCLETEARILSLLSNATTPITTDNNNNSNTRIRVPDLLSFEARCGLLRAPYMLTTFTPGTSLRVLEPQLTEVETKRIYRTLGTLTKTLSRQYTAAAFGQPALVQSGHGSRSWRGAFCSLLESVLRDAEDMLVSLPYEQIREQVDRVAGLLEGVVQARLVALNLADSGNVLLSPTTKQITGLSGFGNAIWGDVLMAEAFVDAGMSGPFLEGLGAPRVRIGAERMRVLLYACYRAVVTIAAYYYRPRDDGLGLRFELEARKSLTGSLAQLAAAHI